MRKYLSAWCSRKTTGITPKIDHAVQKNVLVVNLILKSLSPRRYIKIHAAARATMRPKQMMNKTLSFFQTSSPARTVEIAHVAYLRRLFAICGPVKAILKLSLPATVRGDTPMSFIKTYAIKKMACSPSLEITEFKDPNRGLPLPSVIKIVRSNTAGNATTASLV